MSFHAIKFFYNILKTPNFGVELLAIPRGIALSFDKDQCVFESDKKVDILYGASKQLWFIDFWFLTNGFFALTLE